MNQVSFDAHPVIDMGLVCPLCKESYLHQRKARVTFRDQEDSDGTMATSDRASVSVSRVKDADIPGRRDVIEIDFECENCHGYDPDEEPTMMLPFFTLQIMQHKGNTLMEWFVLSFESAEIIDALEVEYEDERVTA